MPGPPGAGGGGAEFRAWRGGGSVQREFTFARVGAGHHDVQHRARTTVQAGGFLDQARPPINSCPPTRQGWTGLIRGNPSGRTVPSIATGTAASRAIPKRAISGAPCSRSRQPANFAGRVTAVTVPPSWLHAWGDSPEDETASARL
jgi:hypothetical protein